MSISIDSLKKLALRLQFDMLPEQYVTLQQEFDVILKQMNLIGEIEDVDQEEPMTFPFSFTTSSLREDVPSDVLTVEEVLQNAKEVRDDMIKIKKVVG